ncbi:hypothetical protein COV11_03085 [Candidatus Woesearchaeota archaeon CG10_big_fil_rev_8_21_14_0_10_30_7]|nr:MAG: hypothetical protein COV11_03085 [Candidatus Woesearchaeota archaeon CG10_big_fil_rev_8_21_14_0_10_30_7]
MKCHKCKKRMKYDKNISFNEYIIDGWECTCGEIYFNTEQAQKVLIINRLKKTLLKVKLGRIRSNLILRLPKVVEQALDLKKGESVTLKLEDNGLRVLTE